MTVGNFTPYEIYNGTDMVSLFRYGNTILGNSFSIGILSLCFLIIFISVSKIRPSKDAFAVSSWITGIFAILLWAAQALADSFTLFFIALMFLSIVMLWVRKNDDYY